LPDALGAEGMRHRFSFASMFGAVARVEEAALDGDEGIVVVAVAPAIISYFLGWKWWKK